MSTTDTIVTPTDRSVRPVHLASLVAAPLVALIARLLWTPFDEDDTAAYLADLSENSTRSDIGALLMILSAALLVPAAFALATTVRRHKPTLARTATAMVVLGAVGMACMSTLGIVATELARQPDRAAMVDAWDGIFNESDVGNFVFAAVLVGIVGFLVLAVGLYRTGGPPVPAAVLVGLGGGGLLITSCGPVQPVLVAAALVALAGFAWTPASARQ